MDIQVLKDRLAAGAILKVKFIKADGTERVMRCTTSSWYIPADKIPSGESLVKHNDKVQRVFDLEKDEWRSFILSTVLEFKEETTV